MELKPGQIVGSDYRVVQLLAAGGMGQVYVVEQLSTGKRRALKVMHRDLAADAESQRRFMQEARVGSLIASEHIVEVQNAGIDASTGQPFLVMELLEGEDLQARLARGPLAIDEARVVVEQLGHALGAAHDAHVVHRDLKPQNIFLSVRRSAGITLHVKVLDFGIAKVMESRNATAATGTPLWLAPEQTERAQITSAADVWALGLVVFTMLTGGIFWRTPSRKDGSLIDLLGEILREPIPPATARAAELGRSLPPGFDAWFQRCLSRSPNDRFPNAREASAALAPILAEAARPVRVAAPMTAFVPPAAFAPPPRPPPPPPAPSSRVGLVVALVIGLLVVVAVAGGVALYFFKVVDLTPPATSTSNGPMPALPSGAPLPLPAKETKESGGVQVFAMSDDPELQMAFASDATLTSKVEECVAPVRATKGASLLFVFEVSGGAMKPVMTQAKPTGPHVQCVANAIRNRTLPSTKKKAGLQVVVSWT